MVLSLSSPLSLSFAGPASGVAPSVQMKAAATPKFAYGLPGGAPRRSHPPAPATLSHPHGPLHRTPTDARPRRYPPGNNILGEFDPLNLLEGKSKLEVYKYREAELTHGRVAMLASLGFLVQEKFHPLFSGDTDIAINQVPQLPIWLWAGMLAGIAGAEQTRIAKGWQKLDQRSYTASESLREGYMPGDLGFDPFKIKPQDPEKLLDMQEKELSHGRLAMIAAMGFLAQETVTGQTWGAFWGDASF